MNSVKVKICGITNESDATAAVHAGADALGFIFYEGSPRYIKPERAAKIVARLPPFVITVGVFVNMPTEVIQEVQGTTGIHVVQLHGDESPEFCKKLDGPVIKALRVRDESWRIEAETYPVSALLLDTFVETQYGGTGKTFDWKLVKNSPYRIILSGGLNPGNLAKAARIVRPYGIDTGSGVELEPGLKDHKKMEEFLETARGLP